MKLKPISNVGNQRALLYRRYNDYEMSINLSYVYKTYDNKYWRFDNITKTFIETISRTTFTAIYSYTIMRFGEDKWQYLGGEWIDAIYEEDIPSEYTYEGSIPTSGLETEVNANITPMKKRQLINAYMVRGANKVTIEYGNYDYSANVGFYITHNGQQIYSVGDVMQPNTSATYTFPQININGNEDVDFYITANPQKLYEPTTGGEITITVERSYANELSKYGNSQKYQLNKYYYVGSFNYMLKGGVDTEDVQYIKGAITPTRTIDIRWFEDEMQIDHDDLVVLDNRLWVVNSVSWDIKRMPKPFKIYFGTLTSIL